MSTINILFNDKNYDIDETAISEATAKLKSHLSTVMNGTGSVIDFGGVSYNIDSTKLSSATNAFISYLGKISGSGSNVTVGGVQYGVDSAKLSGAISDLHTVLGGLNSGSDVKVVFEEQTLNFVDDGSGVYAWYTETPLICLIAGNTYTIIWDGVSYTCTAAEESNGDETVLYCGNRSFIGSEDTGEPFVVLSFPDSDGILTMDTSATHTVAIYKGVYENGGGSVDEYSVLVAEMTKSFSDMGNGNSASDDSASNGSSLGLVNGYEYKVVWDDEEYVCTAKQYEMDYMKAICIGNASIVEVDDDSGEPFFFADVTNYDMSSIFAIGTETSHTFAIYTKYDGYEQLYFDNSYFPLSENTSTYSPDTNSYSHSEEATYTFSSGYMYKVIIDGIEYFDTTMTMNNGVIYIGDRNLVEVPFFFVYIPTGVDGKTVDTIDYYIADGGSHGICVCQKTVLTSGCLLDNKTATFEYDESYNETIWFNDYYEFELTAGETYKVIWDGTEYTCQAKDMMLMGAFEAVALGNTSINTDVEEENSGEPFLIVCVQSMGICGGMIPDDADTTHTISVYKN